MFVIYEESLEEELCSVDNDNDNDDDDNDNDNNNLYSKRVLVHNLTEMIIWF